MKYAVFCLLYSALFVEAKEITKLVGMSCIDTEKGFECTQAF